MNLSDVKTVFQKEILDIVRDARTLLIMAIIPTVFMPLLLVAPQTMAEKTISDVKASTLKVLIAPENAALRAWLATNKNIAFAAKQDDPLLALRTGKIDVWVEPPPDLLLTAELPNSTSTSATSGSSGSTGSSGTSGTSGSSSSSGTSSPPNPHSEPPHLNIKYDGRQLDSFLAESRLTKTLFEERTKLENARIKALGLKPEHDLLKINWKTVPLDKKVEVIGMVPKSVPPMLLFMLLITLIYPSLDLITGERERGTMALLLVARASHKDIMLGKVLSVCCIGLISLMFGLTSLFFTLNYFVAHNKGFPGLVTGISPSAVIITAILSIPIVLLCTSLSFLLTGMCKNFQQGQGYFLPFVALIMMPAGICSMQNVQLSSFLALIPIGNIMLAMRDVIANNYDPIWLIVAWVIAFIYAAIATKYTVTLLDREEAMTEGTTPAVVRRRSGDYLPEAALLLAICFLLMFYGGQIAQAQDAFSGILLSQVFCILTPAIICIGLLKKSFLSTLSLHRPKLRYLAAAVLLAPAVAGLSIGIAAVQSLFLPVPESYAKAFLNVILQPGRPLLLVLAVFALLPAICEEILFRGAIQGLLREKLSPRNLVLVVGLSFGLFHMSSFRFLPTATMGMVLSVLTILSGSIFPSMVLHALHNSILIACEYYKLHDLTPTQAIACAVSGALGLALLLVKAKKVGSG